jgi:DNA-binding CsgD family transcriptional regulator
VPALGAALPIDLSKALAIPAHDRTRSIRDVEHVVFLMQENRSFDHYFGTLRGVRGFGEPHPVTLPSGKSVFHQPDGDGELLPFRPDVPDVGRMFLPDPPHGWADTHAAFDEGRHDRVRTGSACGRIAAREQLRAAAAGFDALGLDGWTARATAELAATGQRPRRGPRDGDQLSSQETRVALLVARGLSNRDVAAALFVSPRTVEHHVSNVLRKSAGSVRAPTGRGVRRPGGSFRLGRGRSRPIMPACRSDRQHPATWTASSRSPRRSGRSTRATSRGSGDRRRPLPTRSGRTCSG